MPSELGIVTAAKKYKVSKQGLVMAIKRGALPAIVVQTSELRVKPKDVEAYVASIPEFRKRSGRAGGLATARRRKTLAATRRASARSPQSASATS
jgi:hypothetical protein